MARGGGFPGMRGGGGGGMGNMQQMLRQAQKMQEDMEKLQEELKGKRIETTAGGGAVKAVVSGAKELVELSIQPDVVDPQDVEMLQDLIIAAVNEGFRQVEELSQREMGKLTGGMNMGGLF